MIKRINEKKFTERLKKVKSDNNWTLEYIGNLAGRVKSNVSSWIKGDSFPSNSVDLLPLAKAAGVSLEWLMGFEPIINSETQKVPIYDINISDINTSIKDFISNNAPSGFKETSDTDNAQVYVTYTGGTMHPMILNTSKIGIAELDNINQIKYGSIHCIKTEHNTFLGYVNYMDNSTLTITYYNNDVNKFPLKKSDIIRVFKVVSEIRVFE